MKKRLRPYLRFCVQQRQAQLLRLLPVERPYLYDFSSNDYLGFSQNPQLIQAAIQGANEGVGAKSARLITQTQDRLQNLEKAIAKAKGTQAALIFATGYQANLSVLSALLDPRILKTPPLVFADRLNHASMHAGCQLAQVQQIRYRHLDYDHLAWCLAKTQTQQQPRFILTESVFGMDGDVADLPKLIQLARQYDAMLYVDEAHATGILGKQGYGLTSDFGNEIDISMGTFSKALGGSGAYIACARPLKRYFINRCTGFIFSTAPSPMQVAAMQAAWSLIPSQRPQVTALLQKAAKLREALQSLHLATGHSTTHIIPIIFHTPQKTLAAQRWLATQGIRVSAIRPPSVPPQQSRLRIALSTQHTEAAIEALLKGLQAFIFSF